jgi:drug/metabolite transporter (DMT)-like permease
MSRKTALAEIFLVISAAVLAVMAMLIKLVPADFTGPFISVVRFVVGIALGLAYLKFTRTPFQVQHRLIWILRGFFGSVAMALYFTAIQMTGSGRATLLLNTFPIFVALFGYIIFRETISIAQFISIVLCVIGVVLVFYDGSSYSLLGNLLGLASGVIRGMSVHFIKRSAASNHPAIVYLSACFWGMLLLPVTVSQVTQITWHSGILLLLVGTLAFIGQMFMTHGIRYVSTIKASLFAYSTIPLTIFFGFLIGEELHGKFFLGIVFILSGLLLNSGIIEKQLMIPPRKSL